MTTLGGHLLAPFIERRIKPYRLGRTIADIHEAGGIAIPAHPLVPYLLCAQGWMLRRLLDDVDEAVRPMPSRSQPDGARATVARSGRALRRRASAGPDRHMTPTPSTESARAGRRSWARPPRSLGRPSMHGRRITAAPSTGRSGVGRGVRPADPQAGDRRTRRGRRPDPKVGHGPRPRLPRRRARPPRYEPPSQE